ncbi:MAG: hypothetical protein FWF15_04170 [Oscillospiraceae bacterium]|nr:hypothetical protein [Oscillospiraceae bacterium]
MKKLSIILLIVLLLASCGGNQAKPEAAAGSINPVIKLFVRFGVFDVFVIEERSNAIFG